MKYMHIFDTMGFKFVLSVILSFALIEIVFVASGLLLTPYYFYVLEHVAGLGLLNIPLLLVLLLIERKADHSRHENRRLLQFTFVVTSIASVLVAIFSK